MRRVAFALCAALVAAGGISTGASAATVFNFQFDNQGITDSDISTDGPLSGPIVGTGTLTSSVDLAPGTYDINSLIGATLTLDLSFADGNTYSGINITTPPTGIALNIVDVGGGVERLFFTESGGPGSDDGGFGGALDLFNGSATLSFEPSGFGGNFLYGEGSLVQDGSGFSGRYLALSDSGAVPEPSTWAMMLLGFGAIGVAARRRKTALLATA